jgi:hypothetical protein
MLDLPGLQKSVVRDDDADRTRRIHAVFKWTLFVCLGMGCLGAVVALSHGDRDNESIWRLLSGLVCGLFFAAVAAFLYALASRVKLQLTGGEEFGGEQREATEGGARDEPVRPDAGEEIVEDGRGPRSP